MSTPGPYQEEEVTTRCGDRYSLAATATRLCGFLHRELELYRVHHTVHRPLWLSTDLDPPSALGNLCLVDLASTITNIPSAVDNLDISRFHWQ
ncbi:hypothetical protein VTJ04DRAFT_4690 [Mycothermus thermophilus]|uniref:uncharacterized protein n=1 Tax=Humicola insolens TaxID=85995 RepID=UPI003742A220